MNKEISESGSIEISPELIETEIVDFDIPEMENHTAIATSMSQSEFKCNCGENCAICKDALCNSQPLFSTNCGHVYHQDCLNSWSKSGGKFCPMCKSLLLSRHSRRVYLNHGGNGNRMGSDDFVDPSDDNRLVGSSLNVERDEVSNNESIGTNITADVVQNEMSPCSESNVAVDDATAQQINLIDKKSLMNVEVRVVLEHLDVQQHEIREESAIAYMSSSDSEEEENGLQTEEVVETQAETFEEEEQVAEGNASAREQEEKVQVRPLKRTRNAVQKFSHSFVRSYVCRKNFADYDGVFSPFDYNVCSTKCALQANQA